PQRCACHKSVWGKGLCALNPIYATKPIQSENPHGERQRTALSDSLRQLSSMVEAKDGGAFSQELQRTADRLGMHLASNARDCQAMFSSLA
ncbi:hypothetical protein PWG14_26765, partial [Chromobacterium amazonense]|uniref:hypothetical protein n=1 Tax=Chromobacterium amazonense TaxID=1382803 RepID=UPI00237ED5B5